MDIRFLMLLLMASLAYRSAHAATPEPVDNAVQPCDQSSASGKPPCNADADSIIIPPKVPTAPADVIEPPPISDKGIPEPPDPVPPPMPLDGPDVEPGP
jgi:hypothetical protein